MPRYNKAKRGRIEKAKKMILVMQAKRVALQEGVPLERLNTEVQELQNQGENETTYLAPLSSTQDPGAEDLSFAQSTSAQEQGVEKNFSAAPPLTLTEEPGGENLSSAPLEPTKKPVGKNLSSPRRPRTQKPDTKIMTYPETGKIIMELRDRKRKITKESQQDLSQEKKQKKQEVTAEAKKPRKYRKKINTFGLYVAEKLNQISARQRVMAEKIIFNILFLAKTNYLDVNSRIQGLLKTSKEHTPQDSIDLTRSTVSTQTSQTPQFPSTSSSSLYTPEHINSPLLSQTHQDPHQSPLSQNTEPISVLYLPTPDTITQIIVKDEVTDDIFENVIIQEK